MRGCEDVVVIKVAYFEKFINACCHLERRNYELRKRLRLNHVEKKVVVVVVVVVVVICFSIS